MSDLKKVELTTSKDNFGISDIVGRESGDTFKPDSIPGKIEDMMEDISIPTMDHQYDDEMSHFRSPTQGRKRIVTVPGLGAIDNDDYSVLRGFLMLQPGDKDDIIGIKSNDYKRRVYRLNLGNHNVAPHVKTLPPSIGELKYLEELDLGGTKNLSEVPREIGRLNRLKKLGFFVSGVSSLPPSIGDLHNLEELDLVETENLLEVPKEIGRLARLKKLTFTHAGIKSLPPSIGQLQNLEELDLGGTRNLFEIPEDIGKLYNLKKLSFHTSGIRSLSCSLGLLQNLEELDLRRTRFLSEIPEEIGNLTNLKYLALDNSSIKSLPPSIGQLQNLEDLDLSRTRNLLELPDEIGMLTNLKTLSFYRSEIKFLPPSIGQLQRLEELDLECTKSLLQLPEEIGKLTSLKKLRFYGSGSKSLSPSLIHTLAFSQGYQRALRRTGLDNSSKPILPSLWPLLLSRAGAAFWDDWSSDEENEDAYSVQNLLLGYHISEPDAIHQFLLHGQDSFFRLIVNRPAGEGP